MHINAFVFVCFDVFVGGGMNVHAHTFARLKKFSVCVCVCGHS